MRISPPKAAPIYLGTFLIAFATLAFEISLTRIFSIVAWYHLAFFALSSAMLGMTAGAIHVFRNPRLFTPGRLHASVAASCLKFGLAVPIALLAILIVPVPLKPTLMTFWALLIVTAAASLPFYFSGIAISAILTRCTLPIGRVYASDLVGAASGCLFVLLGLQFLDTPSFVLLAGSLGAAAGLIYAGNAPRFRFRQRGWALLLILALAVPLNASTRYAIRPMIVKGRVSSAADAMFERWNSFSRISVSPLRQGAPQLWEASMIAPNEPADQHVMDIDGEAGTFIRQFRTKADISHLGFDLTNMVHYVRPTGPVCVIGVGGGRDVQSALLYKHNKVVGIEINPIFIDLLENRFRGFAGLAGRDDVRFVVDEARSYLSASNERYSVLQMSLIDTWAATGAGAFSLSENGLYTVEAWQTFLSRLDDDGIFTVSRWYNEKNLGETGRMLSLAVASLLREGAVDPSRHIALITGKRIATLLICKRPFTAAEIEKLRFVSGELWFTPSVLPGTAPANPVLAGIMGARSADALRAAIAGQELNYTPPTDDQPYFFNMLKLSQMGPGFFLRSVDETGVLAGNVTATLVLVALIGVLFILAVFTILVPVMLPPRYLRAPKSSAPPASIWPGAFYFSLIGAGFMFVEIGLIQRFTIYLSHPVYTLGILLFSIILSTGIGSFLSEFVPVNRRRGFMALPLLMALAVLAAQALLPELISRTITWPIQAKIPVAIVVLFPLGLLMGFFFPVGMRLAQAGPADHTPWFWGLNGIFGVLSSSLAVFCSIYVGITASFYIGAACYLLLLIPLVPMSAMALRSAPAAPEPQSLSGGNTGDRPSRKASIAA